MNEQAQHTPALAVESSPSGLGGKKRERKWTGFLDPKPSRSGRCSKRRHFSGLTADIMNFCESMARRDPERFVWATISAIARSCRPGRPADRHYVAEVLGHAAELGWHGDFEDRVRHSRYRHGFIVHTHGHVVEKVANRLVTLAPRPGDFGTTAWRLSHQGLVTLAPSKTDKKEPQVSDNSEVSALGKQSEPLGEPVGEPVVGASEKQPPHLLLWSALGIGPTGPARIRESVKEKALATVGLEKFSRAQLSEWWTEWKAEIDGREWKIPQQLVDKIRDLREEMEAERQRARDREGQAAADADAVKQRAKMQKRWEKINRLNQEAAELEAQNEGRGFV